LYGFKHFLSLKEMVLKLKYNGRPASIHSFVYLWRNCGKSCATWCVSLPYSFLFPLTSACT
jgi:hypothetical protein